MKTIPMYKPLIEKEEMDAAKEALQVGWLGMGSYVDRFEKSIKKYVDAKYRYVAVVSTGHAALHLGLKIAGVGLGDEVITPSFNNIADFQAILAVGAEPVFCDVDEKSLCIDIDKAEELISSKTKAIITMDYGCMLCDHDRASEVAKKYGIRIIHDAAHAFGSEYKNKMIGSFSDICMFSFDPVKNITCIDGGAIIVKEEEELKKIHEMRLIGMGQPASVMYKNQRAWTYDVKDIGFRYHMSNIHAAIGLAQMKKIEIINETRRYAASYWNRKLGQIAEIKVPQTNFDSCVPFLYYIRVPEELRKDFQKYLLKQGIETGIHWQPGHWFSLFRQCRKGDLSVTEKIVREIVSLPLHAKMPQDDIDRIAQNIGDFFK